MAKLAEKKKGKKEKSKQVKSNLWGPLGPDVDVDLLLELLEGWIEGGGGHDPDRYTPTFDDEALGAPLGWGMSASVVEVSARLLAEAGPELVLGKGGGSAAAGGETSKLQRIARFYEVLRERWMDDNEARRAARRAAHGGSLQGTCKVRIAMDFTEFYRGARLGPDGLADPAARDEPPSTPMFALNNMCWREIENVPLNCNLYTFVDKVFTVAFELGNAQEYLRGYHACAAFASRKRGLAPIYPSQVRCADGELAVLYFREPVPMESVVLSDLAPESGDHFWLLYNFSDSYTFRVTVTDHQWGPPPPGTRMQLVAGAGAPPPEDSFGLVAGGNLGYYQTLERAGGQWQPKHRHNVNYCSQCPEVCNPADMFDFKFLRAERLFQMGLASPVSPTHAPIEWPMDMPHPPQRSRQPIRSQFYNQVPDICWHCGFASPRLFICAGCQLGRFCSRQCQKNAWDVHKKQCKRWKKRYSGQQIPLDERPPRNLD